MSEKYTLIVPSWYPEEEKPNNGIFIRKHAEAISSFQHIKVLFATESLHSGLKLIRRSPSSEELIVSYKPSNSRIWNQFLLIYSFCQGYNFLTRKYGRPQLVHLHVIYPAGAFVILLLLFRKIPLMITEHWTGYSDADGRYEKLPVIMKKITQLIIKKAKIISVVSESFKKDFLRKFGKGIPSLKDKLFVVSNILRNSPQILQKEFTTEKIKALYIGSLDDHHKNISLLLEATRLVVKEYPGFELHLYGTGPEEDKFKDIASESNLLNQHIFFHGYVSNHEIGFVYETHDIFLMPSRFETFSIATAEALLYGLPVISTKCGGPEEYVNAENGKLVEQNDVLAFTKALKDIIRTYSLHDKKKISQLMQSKYSKDAVISQLKELYRFVGQS